MKTIFLFLIFLLIPTISAGVQPTKIECETGDGIWHQVNEKGYCSCENGLDWDNSIKSCADNHETKCTSTGGTWTDSTCICEGDSTGYDPRFGCTYNDRIQPLDDNHQSKTINTLILPVTIIVLGLLIWRLSKWKRKH